MRMFHPNFNPTSVLANVFCLTIAICLTGCASKTPAPENSAKSAQVTDDKTVGAGAAAGVQKIENPRFLGILSPYRVDIQQGNFVSQEMMSQLKVGMTREQVHFLFGTSLLTDMFHADRWDYLFRLQKGNGEILTSRVAVFFKEDRVARFEGGNLPSEKDFLKLIVGEPEVAK